MIRPQRWGVKWWTRHTGSQFLWLMGAVEELLWILLSKPELSCYIWFSKKSWKFLCLCEISMAETIDAHPKSVNSPIFSSLCCSPVEAIWAVLSNGLWITSIFMGLSLSLFLLFVHISRKMACLYLRLLLSLISSLQKDPDAFTLKVSHFFFLLKFRWAIRIHGK